MNPNDLAAISGRVSWFFSCLWALQKLKALKPGPCSRSQDMVTAAGICLRCMSYGSEETCGHAASDPSKVVSGTQVELF